MNTFESHLLVFTNRYFISLLTHSSSMESGELIGEKDWPIKKNFHITEDLGFSGFSQITCFH